MPQKIFVNLPVRDLKKSMDFFGKLGFTFNAQFTDETAACMTISEDIFVMLLTENKFKTFTPKRICDATKSSEVLVCLSSSSRDEVKQWFARRSPPGEQLTRNRKTTASCTVTDSRIWMGTSGNWPSWSRDPLSPREI